MRSHILVHRWPSSLCVLTWPEGQENSLKSLIFVFKIYLVMLGLSWASQVVLVVKNLSVDAGDVKVVGSIPGSGRSPREGNGYTLQYSCLENPMDRGALWTS